MAAFDRTGLGRPVGVAPGKQVQLGHGQQGLQMVGLDLQGPFQVAEGEQLSQPRLDEAPLIRVQQMLLERRAQLAGPHDVVVEGDIGTARGQRT